MLWAAPTLLVSLVAGAPCPLETDLSELPSAPKTTRPFPSDLETELLSKRASVVPGTIVGPLDLGVLGDHGAIVAALRCAGTSKTRAVSGPCEIVLAHLAPVEGKGLLLSGVVGTLPVRRGRSAPPVLTAVALQDILDSPTPEVVVRWQVGDERFVGALAWIGLSKVLSPERVPPGCQLVARCVGLAERVIERRCQDGNATWRWDPGRQEAVRAR